MSYYGGYPYHTAAPLRPAYYAPAAAAAADPYELYPPAPLARPPRRPAQQPWADHLPARVPHGRPLPYDFDDMTGTDDLLREEEEARAHLEMIQRRRQAARLAAERERAAHSERAEYEAFIAARKAAERQAQQEAVQRELARQAAVRQAREEAIAARGVQALIAEKNAQAEAARVAKQAEKVAARKAYEQEVAARYFARQQAEQEKAQRARERQQKEQERVARAARAEEAAQAKAFERYIAQQAQRQAQEAAKAQALKQLLAQQQQAQRAQQAQQPRPACPRARSPPAHPLLALFGNQDNSNDLAPFFPQACSRSHTASPQPALAPKAAKPASKPVTPVAAPTPIKENNESGFPGDLNDLLSHFLGLRVEPTSESAAPSPAETPSADKTHDSKNVIEGLNKFLGQFGLEFEQDKPAPATADKEQPAAPAAKAVEPASSSTPVRAQANPAEPSEPAQAEKQAFENLPDFLKYAFEMAMTDGPQSTCERVGPSCCQAKPTKVDKGKGVAEGERKAKTASTPAAVPSPAPQSPPQPKAASPADNLTKLRSIAHEFALARDSFTFPERLIFGPTSSDPQHPPALLFNKTNSPYHAQTNKLLQLLLAADDITSDGDKDVRQERKALVKQVEKEIELLEQKRDTLWEEVRTQRERGEEEHHEVESVSSGSSVVDPVEHAETVAEHHDTLESEGEIVEAPVEEVTATSESAPVADITESASTAGTASAPEAEVEVKGFEVPSTAEEPAKTEPEPATGAEKEKSGEAETTPVKENENKEIATEETKPAQSTERRKSFQATVEEVKEEKDEYELV